MSRTSLVAMAVLTLVVACAPPGMTAVTYEGVTVVAPASWGRNQLHCGVPVKDTIVVNPGPVQELCLLYPPPRVNYVWLSSCTDCRSDSALARQAVRVSGRDARRGENRLPDGRTAVVLVVPDRKVVVVAVSLNPSVARGIIDSASIS